MEVTSVVRSTDVTAVGRQYWANPMEFETSITHNRFFRMIPQAENESDKLTLEDLLEHGLKGVPPGRRRSRNYF